MPPLTFPQSATRIALSQLPAEDRNHLSDTDRNYLKAWDALTYTERCRLHKNGISGPLLAKTPRPKMGQEERDPFSTIEDSCPDHRYFDEPAEEETVLQIAAEAVLRVLYILTKSRHPQLRLSTDLLLALINRSDEKSQSAIARKYGLTRAAISKRLRDMRRGEYLQGLEIYFFGGKRDVSQQARTRAIRVHKQRKQSKSTAAPSSSL